MMKFGLVHWLVVAAALVAAEAIMVIASVDQASPLGSVAFVLVTCVIGGLGVLAVDRYRR